MTSEITENPISQRSETTHDLHRPQFHFQPPKNWMNDPNGLCYFRGQYHLFYQMNPYGPLWGFMHWGHASSPDLIHWTDQPIALAPEEGAGDDLGCFSGCIVEDEGVPTAIYTGFVSFVDTPALLARAKDEALIGWEKHANNPIIGEKPAGVNSTDFRDPYVWRQGDRWQMAVGAGLENGNGAILLYESEDLLSWRYLGPAFQDRILDTVTMWECPNFFPLDDKYVLLVSLFPNIQGVYYYVGDYDGRVFTQESQGYFEKGEVFYAPQARRFPDGRTILFGWLREQRTDEAIEAAGWAGVMSLPRELALDDGGRLINRPAKEYEQLRQTPFVEKDLALKPGERLSLPISGRQLEVELTVSRSEGIFELGLAASPEDTEVTLIGCDPRLGKIRLDTTRSSLSGDMMTGEQEMTLPDQDGETIRLRVILDGSVIEIWIDDSFSLAGRIYPTLSDSQHVVVRAGKASVRISDLYGWKISGIW
ncbi:MAG: glycoside hydrolase family 32 protein [Anaerolineaceae bacterium]|nr:glycoside hydrolase family 32 protein [Anaerolineaceae bacterium]